MVAMFGVLVVYLTSVSDCLVCFPFTLSSGVGILILSFFVIEPCKDTKVAPQCLKESDFLLVDQICFFCDLFLHRQKSA